MPPVKEKNAHCTIGKYEVLGTLGRGSMGVVYRARDPEIGREVAIKTLRTVHANELPDADAALDRFRSEARSAGSLRHPNIITIYEVNRDGDTPYLVMDYVEGENLDALIQKRGRLPAGLVMYYLFQIAAGLDHAHTKGVIHRDIKPSNIHVDRTGRVFILDFGVATITESFANAAEQASGGAVIGTPGYMSPEQILSEPLNSQADLFSFAAVAFECLTALRPFPGDTFTDVIGNILNGRLRSLTELAPELPLALEAQFEKALHRQREQRFGSAQEIVLAFCEALGFDPIAIRAQGNPDNLPDIPRKRKSTGWRSFKSVGPTKDSLLSVPEESGAVNQTTDLSNNPWTPDQKPVNFQEPPPVSEEKIRRAPGDMFTRYEGLERLSKVQQQAVQAESSSLRRLTVIFAGLCIALGSGLLFILFGGSEKGDPEREADTTVRVPVVALGQTGNPLLDEDVGLRLPTTVLAPSDTPVEQMNDKQVLGILVDDKSSETMMLKAIEQARKRSLVGIIEASVVPLKHESYLVRVETIKLLAEIGDKRIVPELLLKLDDHDPIVRGHAARALGLLGDRRSLGYLQARYHAESSPEVKASLRRAVERIQGFPLKE